MKVLKEVWSWVSTIAFAVVLAIVINIFILRPSQVIGDSMQPKLHDGDIGLVWRLPRTLNAIPNYGDIVIIDSRVDYKHTISDDLHDTWKYNLITYLITGRVNRNYWVKRVIGKPGDLIEIKNGKVYRNGNLLDEPYIKEPMKNEPFSAKIDEGYIFVMGDNRNNSKDSRVIGQVPLQNVLGKYIFNIN